MSLVRMSTLLQQADENRGAVGAFSVSNMEMILGAVKAAEAMQTPIILQIAECRLETAPLELMGPMMVTAAKHAKVPIAVHFDHGMTKNRIMQAISLGFTSVMFDGSHLPLQENIKQTELINAYAHAREVDCEAEIGQVGGSEDGSIDILSRVTSVDEAVRFSKETGVNALAVAIGNAHGLYTEKPNLQFDRLREIAAATNIPLVLHGGSGISAEDFRKCIDLGIRKINIATEMANSVVNSAIDLFESKKEVGFFDYQAELINASQKCVERHLQIFLNR